MKTTDLPQFNDQLYRIMLYRVRIAIHSLLVMGTDCIDIYVNRRPLLGK